MRHFQAGELPKALAAFELAMTKNPKATQLLSYTATIRVKLGEPSRASPWPCDPCGGGGVRARPTVAAAVAGGGRVATPEGGALCASNGRC